MKLPIRMHSGFTVIAGFVLALLVSASPAVLADTSCTEQCPWVRPVAPSKPNRTKFSLSVALRFFSFSKPATDSVRTDPSPPAELEAPDADRIDAVLESHFSPLEPESDRKDLPKFLSWMRGWRFEKDRGLFRPFRSRSRIAFAYSDIFETGGNPEKGGHGIGLLLRHDFGPESRRNAN